jgi:hypothetical protein
VARPSSVHARASRVQAPRYRSAAAARSWATPRPSS